MRKMSYMKRAARKFLDGTRCKHPIEAVEKGLRTLEDWVDCLNAERELERAMQSTARHNARQDIIERAAA
jgi:hypothetical protein